jgi:serine/threonine protein kinase
VLEYCAGGDLHERLKTRGRLTPSEFVDVGTQLLDALEYIHSYRVAHLDLKPGNILFTAEGHVRIADFGCCRFIEDPPFYGGTEPYMSPEIIELVPDFDKCRSDIWSLGVVFYVMSAGMLPWRNLRDEDLRLAIRVASYDSGPLDRHPARIIAKMLRPDPDARLSIDELRRLLIGCPKPHPLPKRRPSLIGSRSTPGQVIIPRGAGITGKAPLVTARRMSEIHRREHSPPLMTALETLRVDTQ